MNKVEPKDMARNWHAALMTDYMCNGNTNQRTIRVGAAAFSLMSTVTRLKG